MWGAYHVARADFRQRIRSRRLLVVLAVIAYLGYLVTVGTIEMFYQESRNDTLVQYVGDPTAAYIGVTAGITGGIIVLLFGYFILPGAVDRDRHTGVGELVAATPVTDFEYLVGKWLSHLGYLAVLLTALGVAAIANHLVHGVGSPAPHWTMLPVLLFGLPVGAVVAGVTLWFQTTHRLRGTLGSVTYFFGAFTLFSAVVINSSGYRVGNFPWWIYATEQAGMFVAAEMTWDALQAIAPRYEGWGAANFGMGSESAEVVTFTWMGVRGRRGFWSTVSGCSSSGSAPPRLQRCGSRGLTRR